ncbi:hypothetical protein G6L63_11505 [Agrobacterium vitis]|uniref:hypothetical protein n=1 Tax=Agrobacterium vitis TaxID=373 RepID=UPI000ABEFF27|nr:hypothetical protein [Agrobacterium vitis]MUZ97731.1 hypothetical protein [Agrobacterium vitis]MVA30289.1 hypothetical protein [Agrobacterium vitis]NOJ33703.1 hypothetical protein [Agrobacterium vitis]NSZ48535.1 hypothetical protein [Agrobacterium vitis]UJL73134.1 hypothetical protein AVCG412_10065 [Agrobacterium vitis]
MTEVRLHASPLQVDIQFCNPDSALKNAVRLEGATKKGQLGKMVEDDARFP